MTGIIWYEGKGMELEARTAAGRRFICLRLGEEFREGGGWRRWRMGRAAERMGRAGVRRAVFPEGFGWRELFGERGIGGVEWSGLERAAAGAYIRRRLEMLGIGPEGVTAAVSAARADGDGGRLVEELAARYRYTALETEEGGEALAEKLWRELGASLRLGPEREVMEGAEVLVLLRRRPELSGRNPVALELYPGGRGVPLRVREETRRLFPPGLEEKALAAALWRGGQAEAAAFIDEIRC